MSTVPASSRRLALCDVDNTTVNTSVFVECLLTVLVELISIHPATYREEMGKFYSPGLGYDFELHLDQMYGLPLGELRPHLIGRLKRYDIIYADAVVMMGQLLDDPLTTVVAITSGRLTYQSLKFELINFELERRLGRPLPKVDGLAVCGKKAKYFHDSWIEVFTFNGITYARVLVVDDHPDQISAFAPRPGLRLVQARHEDPKYGPVEGRPDIELAYDLAHIL